MPGAAFAQSTLAATFAVLLLGASVAFWLGPADFLPIGLGMAALLVVWAISTPAVPMPWLVALWGLLLTAMLSLYPSVDLSLSLPRLDGIALGVAVVAVLVRWLGSERRLLLAAFALALLVLLFGGVGLAATDWPGGGKGLALDAIYRVLPQLPSGIPFSDERWINPNKLAAPLAMLVPLPAAASLFAPRWWLRFPWGAATLLLLSIVFLTQSRSAYLASGGAVLVLLVIWRRRFTILLAPLLALVVWIALWGFGPRELVETWPAPPMMSGGQPSLQAGRQAAELTLASRREVWGLGWTMVRDFPLTGVGLGAFQPIAETLYGSQSVLGQDLPPPHAHNLLLQVALDLGLPGLGFFALLTGCLSAAARRAIVYAPSHQVQGLAAGTTCGLLAYYLYGLTDVIGLGEKPGVVFWVLAGLLAACARLATRGSAPGSDATTRRPDRHPGGDAPDSA